MTTKLLYVLVSSYADIYLEQAYISMYSAKYYMPDCHITLLTDRLTSDSFIGERRVESSLADEVIVVDINPCFTPQKRSRLLKTGAREYVKGDYLFIDCDTIIVRDLSDVDAFDYAIGACRDTHSSFPDNPYKGMCIKDVRKLGRNISEEKVYFNSGVMYVKDIPQTHKFYDEWKRNYELGYEKGVSMDQPSLALTNIDSDYLISEMPDIWNCELKHGIKYLKDAFIVHYLCTNTSINNDKQFFLLNDEEVLIEVKRTGQITELIKSVVCDPFCGIAEVTHCFAGKDVGFFQTSIFAYFCNRYKKGRENTLIENFIRIGGRVKRFLKG